jgi:glycosyltransferase involved in cell wall biosynthesis
MIRTVPHVVYDVVRGEGLASAMRRAGERVSEGARHAAFRAASVVAGAADAAIVNVSAVSVAPRTGGVAVQLEARLRAERALRSVALLHPGGLALSKPFAHVRRVASHGFEAAVREALAVTGAKAVHLEGTNGVPLDSAMRLLSDGVAVVVSVHDFSLFCARPHLLEEPEGRFCDYSRDLDRCHRCLQQTWPGVSKREQSERRESARRLLAAATGLIFPSHFLLDRHRELFSLPQLEGAVVEPALAGGDSDIPRDGSRRGIAFAGSVKRHKGAHLLPELARSLAGRGITLHVFGGGDAELLQSLRAQPNVVVHGYYRSGSLPSLLVRHDIGLVVLPSIVPESYGLTLTEAWRADASAATFDLGAPADRIRREGGGWLAPLDSGAEGLIAIIDRWLEGETSPHTGVGPSPAAVARTHVDLYIRWGLLS